MNQNSINNSSAELKSILEDLHARNDVHFLRKLWHMGMGLGGLWMYFNLPWVDSKTIVQVVFAIGIAGFIGDFCRLRFPKFNRAVLKIIGPIVRKGEVDNYSGLPFYALGVSGAFYLFDEKIAVLATLFLVFADPISSYFGIRYGKEQILPNKSIQGTVAGFCVCYIISLIYGFTHGHIEMNLIVFSLLAGAIGAFSELMSIFVDDNLTIPLISGAGLTLLNLIFQIF